MSGADELFDEANVLKYQCAGAVAREALSRVLAACVPGAKVYDLCALGDAAVGELLRQVYTEPEVDGEGEPRPVKKGTCVPTSVTCNEFFGSVSPSSYDSPIVLQAGDLVKVEVGAHVAGYPAIIGETRVVGGGEPRHPQAAAVSLAAYVAAHSIQRLLRPGVKNTAIGEATASIVEHFGAQPVKKVVSYEMKRYVTDGVKQLPMARPDAGEERLACGEFEIETGQAFCIDVRVTSGGGDLKRTSLPTNVYKRRVETTYLLKNQSGVKTVRDIDGRFPTFQFAMRQLRDQRTAPIGMRQMLEHELVEPFEVLCDRKKNSVMATVRFTALVLNQRTVCITPIDMPNLDGVVLPAGVPELLSRDAEKHEAGIPALLLEAKPEDMAED